MSGDNRPYVYNPACPCNWCRNGGKPPKGVWLDSAFYGRVYDVTDSYGNEHYPPSGGQYTQAR